MTMPTTTTKRWLVAVVMLLAGGCATSGSSTRGACGPGADQARRERWSCVERISTRCYGRGGSTAADECLARGVAACEQAYQTARMLACSSGNLFALAAR
jgi:hypothetical protein